jgi:hypothetical protein
LGLPDIKTTAVKRRVLSNSHNIRLLSHPISRLKHVSARIFD